MRGIKFEVYPIKGLIHAFQTTFVVQEHQEKINPMDKLLLVDFGNSSCLKSMNNRMSDYNKHTNLPFVYQSRTWKIMTILTFHSGHTRITQEHLCMMMHKQMF
jgi:hypothetical protein